VAELRAQGVRADLVVLDLNLRDGSHPADNVEAPDVSGDSTVEDTTVEDSAPGTTAG